MYLFAKAAYSGDSWMQRTITYPYKKSLYKRYSSIARGYLWVSYPQVSQG